MTHRFIPSKKFNRDRREDAFARSVIAIAEQKRREAHRCIRCNTDYTESSKCKCGANASLKDNHAKTQTLLDEAQEVLNVAECEHCGRLTCLGDCPQYYESLQDQGEEWNADDQD